MVGSWQSSRYLMEKNKSTIVRATPISAIGVFLLEFLVGITAVMVNLINPEMHDSSKVKIWAAMNLLPKLLGVIMLTGVISAGISSATIFLSLIGVFIANDILNTNEKRQLELGK